MKVLLLNQCFWPDVVATGQQLTMLARRLSDRGHQVTVITSRRGYDNPAMIFAKHERLQGVEIFASRRWDWAVQPLAALPEFWKFSADLCRASVAHAPTGRRGCAYFAAADFLDWCGLHSSQGR
jgi:hypothetical protein